MDRPESQHSRFQSRIRKGTYKLAYWTSAWLLSTALLAFGPKFVWSEKVAITLLALGINLVVGVFMIIATRNHLRELDELYQKVHLEAMGITLGVTLIVGVAYSVVDSYDAVPFDASIDHMIMLMALTFLASLFWGLQRYR